MIMILFIRINLSNLGNTLSPFNGISKPIKYYLFIMLDYEVRSLYIIYWFYGKKK